MFKSCALVALLALLCYLITMWLKIPCSCNLPLLILNLYVLVDGVGRELAWKQDNNNNYWKCNIIGVKFHLQTSWSRNKSRGDTHIKRAGMLIKKLLKESLIDTKILICGYGLKFFSPRSHITHGIPSFFQLSTLNSTVKAPAVD